MYTHTHTHTHTHNTCAHPHRWGQDDDYAAEVARKEHAEEENIKQKLAKDDTDSEKVWGGEKGRLYIKKYILKKKDIYNRKQKLAKNDTDSLRGGGERENRTPSAELTHEIRLTNPLSRH